MRNLFLIILSARVIFSQIIQFRLKGLGGDSSVPSIYWVTDPHPARKEQVRIFREWLKKKGYPDIEVTREFNLDEKELYQPTYQDLRPAGFANEWPAHEAFRSSRPFPKSPGAAKNHRRRESQRSEDPA